MAVIIINLPDKDKVDFQEKTTARDAARAAAWDAALDAAGAKICRHILKKYN